jgi:DhnA family fructose-bisphosphate aldolase class Ia
MPFIAEAEWPSAYSGATAELGTDYLLRNVRVCAELGADIIKTVCPQDPAEFAAVAEICPVPVVVLGGPRMASEDDVVALARRVVSAGGAGIAFGRNVWGSPDPRSLICRLHEAVHG